MAHPKLLRLAFASVGATFVTIASGGLVNATGSAAACPDWPVCTAALAAPVDALVWLALGHRLLVLLALVVGLTTLVTAWRARPIDRLAGGALLVSLVLLTIQIGFGGLMIELQRYDLADVGHLALALATFSSQVVAAVALWQPSGGDGRLGARAARTIRRMRVTTWWAAGAAAVLALAVGARSLPGLPVATLGLGMPADLGGALGVATLFSAASFGQIWRSRRQDRLLLGLASLALALLAVEVVVLLQPDWIGSLAGLIGTVLVGVTLSLAVLNGRRPIAVGVVAADVARHTTTQAANSLPVRSATRPMSDVVRDYISLTKPKVISLLLVTTLGAMYLTDQGLPSLALIFWTMLGGYLAAGGAGAINCALDSDIDINMGRTSRRPVPSGRIPRRNAMIFGLVLSVLSALVLLVFTTPLAMLLSTLGIVYYAYFYTRLLKRSTWQNIVIGGGAGAIPPLVGWTAMTGSLSLAAVLLFVIVFYWTPPHFWALALVKRNDYARAGVPMLPVVAGVEETRWQILVYSLILVAISLLLTPIGAMGVIYLVAAALLGAIFLHSAWGVWRHGEQSHIWGLYKYSLLYLALLFVAMVADRLILV
jgi:protoheme IX farnesyltransferase